MTYTENTSYIICGECGFRITQLGQDWCWKCQAPPKPIVRNPTLTLTTTTPSNESEE